jgi:hypothetical protein
MIHLGKTPTSLFSSGLLHAKIVLHQVVLVKLGRNADNARNFSM